MDFIERALQHALSGHFYDTPHNISYKTEGINCTAKFSYTNHHPKGGGFPESTEETKTFTIWEVLLYAEEAIQEIIEDNTKNDEDY